MEYEYYEYKVTHTTSEMTTSQLNLLGKQGWELVAVTFLEYMYTYYLRKKKIQKPKTEK